ncbi:MAG: signal peptidase II [Bdellovibrionales bacterium]|nr:signal peptidase II [Bdellovibrionales bacterium]
MKNKYVLLAVSTLVIVIIDQLTKHLIVSGFQYGESVDVISNIFNITYVRNPGAAFGIFRTMDSSIRDGFFLLMPPAAMTVIFFMLKSTHESEKIRKISLCAIFAGALGNYIDRIRFGYVVDFLDFHYHDKWVYPAFNVADISIVCGVSVLIILEILLMKQEWLEKKVA